MRNSWLAPLLPLTLLPAACTIDITDGDDEIGETDDATDDASDATSESADGNDDASSESADSSSDDATSESADGSSDDASSDDTTATGDTTETGGDECPAPANPAADFSYTIDIPGVDAWDADITWTCDVLANDNSEGLVLTLDCPEANGPVEIAVYADPEFGPTLMDGLPIEIRYVSEGPWWFNSYLNLSMGGYHLLTLVDGDSLLPPDPYVFVLPFEVEAVSGLCAPVPDGCGDKERLGLAFDSFVAFEGDYVTGVLGEPGKNVHVGEATHLHDVQCTDTPDEWFRVLITTSAWE